MSDGLLMLKAICMYVCMNKNEKMWKKNEKNVKKIWKKCERNLKKIWKNKTKLNHFEPN